MNKYKLVYDFIEDPNSFSYENSLFIGLAGALLLAYIYHKGIKKYKKLTISFGILAIVLSITSTYVQYKEYTDVVEIIESSKTSTTEGEVSELKPIDLKNHGSFESFTVDGVKFIYSDYHRIQGYHHTCELGGVICKEGQLVKLEYYEDKGFNYIVRIEINEEGIK